MVRGEIVLTIPNPHGGDIGVGLLEIILKQGRYLARRMGWRLKAGVIRASELRVGGLPHHLVRRRASR